MSGSSDRGERLPARAGIRLLPAIIFVLALPSVSTPGQEHDDLLELARSDLRSEREALLTESLDLTDEEAEIFWPIYREYEAELSKIGDRRIALLKRYGESHETLSDEQATSIVEEWLDLEQSRLELWRKYFDRLSESLGPKTAALFVQLENQIGLLIDVGIASETPLVER